jgi:hypothetical protein
VSSLDEAFLDNLQRLHPLVILAELIRARRWREILDLVGTITHLFTVSLSNSQLVRTAPCTLHCRAQFEMSTGDFAPTENLSWRMGVCQDQSRVISSGSHCFNATTRNESAAPEQPQTECRVPGTTA